MPGRGTRQRGLCRVPRIRHSAKRVLNFLKKIPLCRVPSQGHLAKKFWKKNSLPSAVSGALGKVFSKKNLYRVPNSRHSAKKDVAKYRYAGQPMPSAVILPKAWHLANKSFAECPFLPTARHSAKNSLPSAILCRVRHSAKKVFAECPIFYTR